MYIMTNLTHVFNVCMDSCFFVSSCFFFLFFYQVEKRKPFPGGLLVCGEATNKPGGGTIDENKHLIKAIRAADPTTGILFVDRAVQPAMAEIERNVTKLSAGDTHRTDAVVQQYRQHMNLDVILG